MTPREAAKDLIRVYVERGDSFEHLKASYLGAYCEEYSAHIGGYVGDLPNLVKIKSDEIGVEKINGRTITPQIFSLRELYEEIKLGKEQVSLF